MRNRAKCYLCKDIIESKAVNDRVICSCGEISVDGGLESYLCSANNFGNFLRVDDEGNEIIVKVQYDVMKSNKYNVKKPGKKELIEMLDEMIKKIEDLPPQAMSVSITHYDFYSSLLLLSSILKSTD